MSKARKSRRRTLLSDSLKEQIDEIHDPSRHEIYQPTKDKHSAFLDIVDESISKVEGKQNSKKNQTSKKGSIVLGLCLLFFFVLFCLGVMWVVKEAI